MSEILKIIVKSEIPNVLIEDSGVFLDNKGDSIDLIGKDVRGKPFRSLEKVCSSISLDNLVKLGYLTLWNKDGIQMIGLNIEKLTNLATIYNTENSESIKKGTNAILNGVDSLGIIFNSSFGSSLYSVVANIKNNIDPSSSIYSWNIIEKNEYGFTVKLSGVTDSANYCVEWVAVKE